jgi:drug/metabolite transporter (DMT)-like permease
MTPPPDPAALLRARLMLVMAAVLWSTSSVFIRLLQQPGPLGLNEPALTPLQLAFYRSVFAGVCLLPLVRRRDVRLRPSMGLMVLFFGVMTGLYLSALGLGPAANAILLQNTAPVWVYLVGVYLLGDPPDRRTLRALLFAMLGAAVIVIGNWPRGLGPDEQATQGKILLMAVGSGVSYAGVILFLRALRTESPAWLTVLNMFGSGSIILMFVAFDPGAPGLAEWLSAPNGRQLVFMALFGSFQMALPYWLFTRGLRVVSPQEAGFITLLEPVLNPVWAYLIAPDRETPTVWTWAGGGVLLAALGWRYFPTRRPVVR